MRGGERRADSDLRVKRRKTACQRKFANKKGRPSPGGPSRSEDQSGRATASNYFAVLLAGAMVLSAAGAIAVVLSVVAAAVALSAVLLASGFLPQAATLRAAMAAVATRTLRRVMEVIE